MTSFDHFKAKSALGNVIAVQESLWLDTETPVSIYLKLREQSSRSFLFESVEGGRTVGRYSIIGIDPVASVTIDNEVVRGDVLRSEGELLRPLFDAQPAPMECLRSMLRIVSSRLDPENPRFAGGWVGYVGYDSIALAENIPLPKESAENPLPDISLSLYTDVVILDNIRRSVTILSNAILSSPSRSVSDLRSLYESACARVVSIRDRLLSGLSDPGVHAAPVLNSRSITDRETYLSWVTRAKKYINAGDIFQVVVSRREVKRSDQDPFAVYRALRRINPSPYMYYLSLEGSAVIGSSPEMLIRVENGRVQTRPIAGTRRRGENDEQDKRIEQELLADPKEKAEHLMLVDLARNDVGRISIPGSVQVSDFMSVEKFSHVMHICSTVSGILQEGITPFDALFSCFPAGTLTGAPKIRAMQIISELEPIRRGIYGGAVGYVDFSGNMDTCIAIRTIVARGGEFSLQAGAGIVHDSVPEHEYAETADKMSALVEAMDPTHVRSAGS